MWDKGPIEKMPFDFRVLEFAPNQAREMWTYAACCMSQPEDMEQMELLSKDEVAYKSKYGAETLEQKFDEAGSDYLNPHRANVV